MNERPLGSTDLKRLHRGWNRRTSARVSLLLDGVMTPWNVGAIVRLAAAYRVERMLLAGATAPPAHPGARKASMGSERFVTMVTHATADDAIADVRDGGQRVVGVELLAGAAPLFELDLSGDVCLAVGHEEHGLSAACLRSCDAVGYVPLVGRVGSLNVATAAAIALYESRRQEWTASGAAGIDLDP